VEQVTEQVDAALDGLGESSELARFTVALPVAGG
jgi:hypothetical protein